MFILTYTVELNFNWDLALWVPLSDQSIYVRSSVLPVSIVRGLISLSLAKDLKIANG